MNKLATPLFRSGIAVRSFPGGNRHAPGFVGERPHKCEAKTVGRVAKLCGFLCLFFHMFVGQTYAQSQSQVAPDCSISATLTSPSQTTTVSAITCSFNQTGVWVWTAAYYVDGFSAVTVTVQAAQDNNGAPGVWGTMSGVNSSVGCGANPCTVATSSWIVLTQEVPWVRVILAGATGSGAVHVTLYGSRNPGSGGGSGGGGGGGGGGCAGTLSTPCVVAGEDSAAAAINMFVDSNGAVIQSAGAVALGDSVTTNVIVPNFGFSGGGAINYPSIMFGYNPANNEYYRARQDPGGRLLTGAYPSTAAISLSSSGLTQIIAAGAGITTVSHYSISFQSAVTFQLEYGTGSNCGTGTTALSGVYQNVASIAIDVAFIVPSGKALCASLGSSVTGGGIIVYAQP